MPIRTSGENTGGNNQSAPRTSITNNQDYIVEAPTITGSGTKTRSPNPNASNASNESVEPASNQNTSRMSGGSINAIRDIGNNIGSMLGTMDVTQPTQRLVQPIAAEEVHPIPSALTPTRSSKAQTAANLAAVFEAGEKESKRPNTSLNALFSSTKPIPANQIQEDVNTTPNLADVSLDDASIQQRAARIRQRSSSPVNNQSTTTGLDQTGYVDVNGTGEVVDTTTDKRLPNNTWVEDTERTIDPTTGSPAPMKREQQNNQQRSNKSVNHDLRDAIFNRKIGYRISRDKTKDMTPEEIAEHLYSRSRSDKGIKRQNEQDYANKFNFIEDKYTSREEFEANPDLTVYAPTADDVWVDKILKAQDSMIRMLSNPQLLKVSGMMPRYDKENRTWYMSIPRRVDAAIMRVQKLYDCSISDVMELVILRTGLGIDSNGLIVGKSPKEFKMSENEFVLACDEIFRSQKKWGHPLGIVAGSKLNIGGTRCFPMGVMPRALARSITASNDSVLDMSVADLESKIRETWLTSTQPNIEVNTQGEKGPNQRYALNNMMRAVLGADGISNTEAYNLPSLFQITWDGIQQEKEDAKRANDQEHIDILELREQEFKKRANRLWNTHMKRNGFMDENGNFIPKKISKLNQILNGIATWERFAGVVGNPPLIVSGYLEHAQGNIFTMFANSAYRNVMNVSDDYKMNDYLKNVSKSQEASKATAMLQKLYDIGGADACMAFGNSTYSMDEKGMAEFIETYFFPRRNKEPGRFATTSKKIDQWYRELIEGRMGMRNADCKRFMEMALINNGINGGINARELQELIQNEGVGKAIFRMAATNEGFDAFISMSNMNLGRKSPLSFATEYALRKNGITNFLLTTNFETYLTYGVNLMQLYLPMSNTFSYMAVTIGAKISPDGRFTENLKNYQLGGYQIDNNWWDGLKKNMIYDLMKLGNTFLWTALWGAFIMFMGQGDPPEDDNKYKWLEYPIGTNFGEEHLIIPAWWLNDMVSWGLPAGTAFNVWYRTHDSNLAWNVFVDGTASMLEGSAFLDVAELLTHPEEQFTMFERSVNGDDYVKPENFDSYLKTDIMWGLVNNVTRKSTPAVLRDYFFPKSVRDTFIVGQASFDHTAGYVYDTVNYTPEQAREENRKVAVDDYEELRLRQMAKNNPVLAIILNCARNGQPFVGKDSNKTGYLFEEMPISTMKDPLRSTWCEYFDHDLDNPLLYTEENAELLETVRNDSYQQILDKIAEYDNPEQAIADGFTIPLEERLNAIKMTYDLINFYELDYAERSINGEYPEYEESVYAQEIKDQKVDELYTLLNDWLQNEEIPWRDDGYALLLTDWSKQYYWPNGELANPLDWYTHPNQVERRYVPLGNSKSSLLPFTEVHTENRGYNYETINSWYVPGLTDTQRIHDTMEGTRVPFGKDAGHLLNNVIFGGKDDLVPGDVETDLAITPGTLDPTTINYRSYVPWGDNLAAYISEDQIARYGLTGIFGVGEDKTSLFDLNADDFAKAASQPTIKEIKEMLSNFWNSDDDKDKAGNAWAKYGGSSRRYGGGGGGGSSYNPRIYSNPHSINTTRAATMYTKQPYNAGTSSYLRPSFSTKGSREAYKRQDI